MKPASTLAEIVRILRPSELFAAYDYDWPPAVNWEFEQVYLTRNLTKWPKNTHLDCMRDSSCFRFTRELFLHHDEQGDAARFLKMVLTNAYSYQFKLKTISEQEIGFDRLRRAAFQSLGTEAIPWYFSYRVRVGMK